MDTVEVISGQPCRAGAENGFVNTAAPEIGEFIDGSEAPPRAPRGGGAVISAVTEPGHLITCDPGVWSGSPIFTYSFITSTELTLQSGPSSTYPLTTADVGRLIYCQVSASNQGGTGVGRTPPLPAIRALASPPASPSASAPVPLLPSTVSLIGTTFTVQRGGLITVGLECEGEEVCGGELTLQARQTVKSKHRKKTRTVTIGHAAYSILGGGGAGVPLRITGFGLSLLRAARGKLVAHLQIADASSAETETQTVHLVESLPRGRLKRKR
jgi:hypothetical protein